MHPIYADLATHLTDLHNGFKKAIADLPPAALDWSPGPNINSLTVLITHTCGAERYWIGDVAGGEPSDRVRAEEFQAGNVTAEKLTQLLDDTLAHSQAVLARFTPADLDRDVTSAAHHRSFRLGWALLHALEHTAQHTAHAELTRQWYDLTHPEAA